MFLEIITPEEKIFSGEVMQATFPGVAGSFQILNNHAPFISLIGKGEIIYKQEKKNKVNISVEGGVVEVTNNDVKVLIEKVFDQ